MDFVNLIDDLNAMGVRYLLIGGQAVAFYGAPIFSLGYGL